MSQRGAIVNGVAVATANPEIKVMGQDGNSKLAVVSLAFNRSWKDRNSDEWKKETCYISCKAWGRAADAVEKHVKKGTVLHVEGMMVQEKWVDAKTGGNRSTLVLRLDGFDLIQRQNNENNGNGNGGNAAPDNSAPNGSNGGGAEQPADSNTNSPPVNQPKEGTAGGEADGVPEMPF